MTSKNYNKISEQVAILLHNLEIAQTEQGKDIEYLKLSLDNHLNTVVKDVSKLNDRMDEMAPKVDRCFNWINSLMKYVVWPVLAMAVLSGVSGLAYLIYDRACGS